jgi:hypothetical protein
MNDATMAEFLRDLDESDDVEVTNWESQFIESNMDRESFSDPQREVIQKMHAKYAKQIGW